MRAFIIPLPILNQQLPVLLSFDRTDPSIELAYERAPFVGGHAIRSATRDTTQYWIPRCTPVFAVSDGTVIYATKVSDGHAILIEHGNELISSYSRLAHGFVMPGTTVVAGDLIGYTGAPHGAPLTPVRFELWRRKASYEPVDPLLFVHRWKYREWHDAMLARTMNDARS